MTRTMGIAFFCLLTLGAATAIRMVAPPPSLSVAATPGHGHIAMGSVPNESAKSDRLKLPEARARPEATESETSEPETIEPKTTEPKTTELKTTEPQTMPAAQAMPAPATEPAAVRIPDRHWRDANARVPPSRPPHLRNITGQTKSTAGSPPSRARAEIWHCRQDDVGSLLRSLDLSPRCNL